MNFSFEVLTTQTTRIELHLLTLPDFTRSYASVNTFEIKTVIRKLFWIRIVFWHDMYNPLSMPVWHVCFVTSLSLDMFDNSLPIKQTSIQPCNQLTKQTIYQITNQFTSQQTNVFDQILVYIISSCSCFNWSINRLIFDLSFCYLDSNKPLKMSQLDEDASVI